ncbi:NRAMP family divalent metal transporter [Alkalihalobacillus sp. NPDC078783]
MSDKQRNSFIRGAIFLMATSSIGPAFLTQTAVFTQELLASFAFAILASIVIDIGAQMNIWRVISVSGMRGQDIAGGVLPGLGLFVAILMVFGGFAFNIGNVAGAGLGLNALFGIPVLLGSTITAAIAIILFLIKDAMRIVDRIIQVLGIIMIVMVGYVMFSTSPPVQEALVKAVLPDNFTSLLLPIVTLVGGTVGGYISFAGGHRLVDAGITGKENVKFVSRAANLGILTTSAIRIFLFLAVLGVVTMGYTLDGDNPAATVFQVALGDLGYKIFGLVLFSAAISSVIGCAYTSISFLRSFHSFFDRYNNWIIAGFIALSTIVFVALGRPVALLIIAGSLNALILPIVLTTVLIASRKKSIVGDYHHPTWLIVFGAIAVLVTIIAGYISLGGIAELWNG